MDPGARNFVPHHAKSPPAPLAAPTKLSAQAVPFIPGGGGGGGFPPPVYADPAAAPAYPPADPSLHNNNNPNNNDNNNANPSPAVATPAEPTTPVEELPPAEPRDWSESRLPKLFNCHNTAAKATATALPLHNPWDLYADDHDSGSTPATPGAMSFDPVLIASVGDLEHFWRVLRFIAPPSDCGVPFTYSFFRHDIRPEWEHPRNKKGGTITIVVFDRDRPELSDPEVLDDVFQLTLVGLAGEAFSESTTTVNGVMFKCRPNKPITLQVWTAHSDFNKLKVFGNSLRDNLSRVMDGKGLQRLEYYSHQQKQADSNSLASRMRVSKLKPDYVI